jgi:hypothetical protein
MALVVSGLLNKEVGAELAVCAGSPFTVAD